MVPAAAGGPHRSDYHHVLAKRDILYLLPRGGLVSAGRGTLTPRSAAAMDTQRKVRRTWPLSLLVLALSWTRGTWRNAWPREVVKHFFFYFS